MLEKCLLGEYFCGDQITTVDLLFYVVAGGLIDGDFCQGISSSVVTSFSRLTELVRKVDEHERVQMWNSRSLEGGFGWFGRQSQAPDIGTEAMAPDITNIRGQTL